MAFDANKLLRPDRAARRGVSLLWVMLGLCAVALIAILAIPAYFHSEGVTLDAASKLLARDLRSLQNHCALSKRKAQLVFDQDGWLALDAGGKPVFSIGDRQPIQRRFSRDGVFEGVWIEQVELGPDAALSVDNYGLTTEAGTLMLRFGEDWLNIEFEAGGGNMLLDGPGREVQAEDRIFYVPSDRMPRPRRPGAAEPKAPGKPKLP